jgi:3,4-dihydroxy-2-butanone 4-phosphate synthase
MNSLNKDFEKFFHRVKEIITDIKAGKIIIIVDDKSQENEGVLFQAAEKVNIESMNFFMTHGKGFLKILHHFPYPLMPEQRKVLVFLPWIE